MSPLINSLQRLKAEAEAEAHLEEPHGLWALGVAWQIEAQLQRLHDKGVR